MQNLEDILDCSTTDLINDIEFLVSTSMEIIISDLYRYETDLIDDLLHSYYKMESIKIIYEIKISLIKRELNVLQPYQLTALWLKTEVGKEQYDDIEDLYYDMFEIINYVYNQINFYRFTEHTETDFLKLLDIFREEEVKRDTKPTPDSIPEDYVLDGPEHMQREEIQKSKNRKNEEIDQSVIENTNKEQKMTTTTKHLLIYIVLGGFAAYLIMNALTAIFVPYVELAKDGCLNFMGLEGRDYSVEVICTEFKNNLEEVKYFHNRSMEELYDNLQLGIFFLFLSFTSLAFYFIPKWYGKTPIINYTSENTISDYINTFGLLLMINYLVVYVIPFIMSIILPPPVEWFPDTITDISSKIRELTLSDLRDIASDI